MRLTPDKSATLVAGGLVLVGGSPTRVLRLTPAGARQVASWFAGAPVAEGASARALARRLLDAGIAHPDFAATSTPDNARTRGGRPDVPGPAAAVGRPRAARDGCDSRDARDPSAAGLSDAAPAAAQPEAFRFPLADEVTVVIPVRDRHAELDRCLAGLRDVKHVIVVDDASADPAAIGRIAAACGATVLHRPVNGGPGAARNTGLSAAATEFVAFLDSDCVPEPGWLRGLLPHFADPAVGAVAPRIVPYSRGAGWLARYEGASSTLDMGARPSIVRPGARVSYVPGAALVVRRAAAGDGFRGGMYVGEDVDFIWRLARAGWRVRYEPRAVMGHDHRVTLRAWFSRRVDYGTSAAALEELHPGSVRPLYASRWTITAWAAAVAGHPATATALTATATALLSRRLSKVTGEPWPAPAGWLDNARERLRPPALTEMAIVPPRPSAHNDPRSTRTRGTNNSHPAPTPAPAPASAPVPAAAPAAPASGSSRPPGRRSVGMVDSSPPYEVENYPPSPPRPDNSNRCLKPRADNSNGRAASESGRGSEGTSGSPSGRGPGSDADNSNWRGWPESVGAGAAWALAVRLAGGGTVAAARPLGSALSRTWWPVAIPAALAVRKLRLPVAALVLTPPLLDWAGRKPPLDPVRYVAARLLDDVAYSIGVWQGCLARRTARPLLPVIGSAAAREPG